MIETKPPEAGIAAAYPHALDRSFLFRPLDPEDRARLLALARPHRYASRQTIFLKGDPGTGLLAVVSGAVQITAPSRDGKRVVLNTIRAGEVFGEMALLDGRPRSAEATALGPCELLSLERRDVLPFLEQHPRLCLKLLEILCERLRRTTEQVEDIVFLDLSARLAKALLKLAVTPSTKGATPFVRASQAELGTMIGATRESVNKHLADWQRRGMVSIRSGIIRLADPAALTELAEL
jgi:CRP/FNR family transcriptional regulator, cyclic AMP receptor protein